MYCVEMVELLDCSKKSDWTMQKQSKHEECVIPIVFLQHCIQVFQLPIKGIADFWWDPDQCREASSSASALSSDRLLSSLVWTRNVFRAMSRWSIIRSLLIFLVDLEVFAERRMLMMLLTMSWNNFGLKIKVLKINSIEWETILHMQEFKKM